MLRPAEPPTGPAHATAPHPVPSTEALRRAALAASWKRDREVGRKRLAWRWAGWLALCFGLPLAVGGALFAVAVWLPPHAETPLLPAPGDPSAPENRPLNLQPDDWLHSKEP